MAYEYERGIIGMLGGIENRHLIDLSDHKQELKEVYRKAKAWQKLKEEKTNNYITYPNAEKRDDLIRMDELDGTHEFSNLLDDMNREEK